MRNIRIITAVISLVLLYGLCFAGEKQASEQEKDRISYSVGYQIGDDLKQQRMELDSEAFLKGVEDGLSTAAPRISPEDMRAILQDMKEKILLQDRRQKQAAVEKYRGEGREFLAENAKKEGVVVLPSGLQYIVVRKGSGKRPGPNDSVTVHYRGTLIDGREFYNTRRGKVTPERFHVGAVIKGMSEALQLMREGSEWQLFVPADLAYDERGPVAERAVIFHVELISVVSGEQEDQSR